MRTLATVVVAVAGAASLMVAQKGDARKQYTAKAEPRPPATGDFDEDPDDAPAGIDQGYAERDQQFAEMDQEFAERDRQFAELDQQLAEQDPKLAEMDQKLAEVDQQFSERDQERTERDEEQAEKDQDEAAAAVAREPDRAPPARPAVPREGVRRPEK